MLAPPMPIGRKSIPSIGPGEGNDGKDTLPNYLRLWHLGMIIEWGQRGPRQQKRKIIEVEERPIDEYDSPGWLHINQWI